jgi:hypothetical protein
MELRLELELVRFILALSPLLPRRDRRLLTLPEFKHAEVSSRTQR